MDQEVMRSALTVLSLVSFLAVVLWAYAPGHRARFERDAMMPFSHEEPAGACGDSPGDAAMPPLRHERDPR